MQNSKKAWIAQRGNKDDGVRVYTAWCWWLDYLSLRRCKWHHRVIQGMRVRTESARLRKAYTTWSASSSFRRLRAHHCLSVVRGLSSRTVRSRQRYIVSRWKAHAHFVSFEEHLHHWMGSSLSSRRRRAALRCGWTCWARVLLRARKRVRAILSASAKRNGHAKAAAWRIWREIHTDSIHADIASKLETVVLEQEEQKRAYSAAVVQEDKERERAEEASSRLAHLQRSLSVAAVARETAENKASALEMHVTSLQNMLETTQKVAQDAQAPTLKKYAVN